jgi:hypothetical protein
MDPLAIGSLITTEQHKDAIHVAVVPVHVNKTCQPGQPVKPGGSRIGNVRIVVPCAPEESIGVIDPFLKQPAAPGSKCWLFLPPGSITSMRHSWTHPALNDESDLDLDDIEVSRAQRFICKCADEIGKSYKQLMEDAGSFAETGQYVYNGSDDSYSDFTSWPEFWRSWSIVTGQPVPASQWAPYRCAC